MDTTTNIPNPPPEPPETHAHSDGWKSFLPQSIIIAAFIISATLLYLNTDVRGLASLGRAHQATDPIQAEGITLPVRLNDIGIKMAGVGLIDSEKLAALDLATDEDMRLLREPSSEPIVITQENARFLLTLFWALSLGNKNAILETGPMAMYDGEMPRSPAEAAQKAGRMASVGGWTIAKGSATDHYSRHPFVVLTPDQQALVERVAAQIYRPCCDNSTLFPDCNHGMAMLGLLELMAAQGANEEDMYRAALAVNSYWFPDTYDTLSRYFPTQGIAWNEVDPRTVLGKMYSSASGYRAVQSRMPAPSNTGSGGCSLQKNSSCTN